jgi:O-antigen ligase
VDISHRNTGVGNPGPTLLMPLQPAEVDWAVPQVRRFRLRTLPPGWPLFCATALFIVWWALGLGSFVFVIFAIPMAIDLFRRDQVKVPPWFGLWLLFLIWSIAGIGVMGADAPDTLPVHFSHGIPSVGLRTLQYLAATIVLLYVGNLREEAVPRIKVVRWLGVLFLTALIGGFIALAKPGLSFASPLERILPHAVTANPNVDALFHPAVAQVMSVIGTADVRPKMPFEYTNAWGNNLSVLLLWFVVAALVYGKPRTRLVALVVLAISIVPIIYSLNRGLWIGLMVAAVYVAVRLAVRGRMLMLGLLALGAVLVAGAFLVTPLGSVVSARLNEGHSNQVRESLTHDAIAGALTSPIIGYGTTRDTIGSQSSIAVGQTADCPRCGNRTIGSNGQLWNVLFSEGFVGATLFVGFLVLTLWQYRHDVTPIGLAGQSAVLLSLLYMFVYVGISSSLSIMMVSIALLWRNAQAHREGLPDPQPPNPRRAHRRHRLAQAEAPRRLARPPREEPRAA